MSYSEEKFKQHIKEVVQSQNVDSNRVLTLEELKELALSMGVTDSEWEDLLQKADASLHSALHHMKRENYTDATQLAEEATSINPYIKDGNAILAQCYLKLAQVEKNNALLVKAENYARMELVNDPLDSTALNVIGQTESYRQEKKAAQRNFKVIGIVGGGILLLFLILWMCSNPKTTNSTADFSSSGNVEQLLQDVEEQKAMYHAAIERRNNHCLELQALIADEDLRENFKNAVLNYDLTNIAPSETELKLQLGEVRASDVLQEEDIIQLEGDQNRIATERGRYQKLVARFNSKVDKNSDYEKIEVND